MASDKGASKDGMDKRLAQARDVALSDGEAIIAQEMGDQGQAIVITSSRILIIKAGLTATGTLNGLSVGAFVYADITAVNVRKGPMGAVIQIQTDGTPKTAASGPPDNVIVFSGDQRIAKCDAIAKKIESALGKKTEHFEPKTDDSAPAAEDMRTEAESVADTESPVDDIEQEPKPMRGGRQAKSLAQEMFEEMTGVEPEPPKTEPVFVKPVAEPEVEPVVEPVIERIVEPTVEPTIEAASEHAEEQLAEAETESNAIEIPAAEETAYKSIEELGYEDTEEENEQTDETVDSYRPNPNLPKPVKKKNSSRNSFVLIGGLMALVLIGMAVTTPLRNPKPIPTVDINVDKLTRNAKAVRMQIVEVENYRDEVKKALGASNQEASALSGALHSGRQAIVAAAGKNMSEVAWRELSKLQAPSGLADAQENIILGAFTRKNAVATALSVGPVDESSVMKRLREADSMIKKGLDDIDKMKSGLNNQLQPVQATTAAKK